MKRIPQPRRKLNRAALPEVMSTVEVAEVLSTTPDGVRQLVKRGHLRAGHVGRKLFFRKEWLFDALDGGAPPRGQEGNGPGAGAPAASGSRAPGSGSAPGCPPSAAVGAAGGSA